MTLLGELARFAPDRSALRTLRVAPSFGDVCRIAAASALKLGGLRLALDSPGIGKAVPVLDAAALVPLLASASPDLSPYAVPR